MAARRHQARRPGINESRVFHSKDFRKISVYPTDEEIFSKKGPILQKNITYGQYSDDEHYLDIQFRLLREDFVAPLREGIAAHQNECEGNSKSTLRFYTNVMFLKMQFAREDWCLDVKVDPKQINFENEKLFMCGSLILFSDDDFKSIIQATVTDSFSNRKTKRMTLKVKLIHDKDLFRIDFSKNYTMAESVAFFNPYYNVLTALQTMSLREYPMCKYIIGQQNSTEPPKYISASTTYNISGDHFRVWNNNNWPNAGKLGLNPTQYKAFKGALTREFAMVQGPPGTGKTYLGLKVAEVLVENANAMVGVNSAIRVEDRPAPLLVVCATNHALDQFLENLLKVTHSLIRVGNQSACEALGPYLLRAQRQEYRHLNKVNQERAKMMTLQLVGMQKKISQLVVDIDKLTRCRGVVSLRSLLDLIGSAEAQFRDGVLDETMFMDWLDVGIDDLKDSVASAKNGYSSVTLEFDFNVVDQKLIKINQQINDFMNLKRKTPRTYNEVKRLEEEEFELKRLLSTITTRHSEKKVTSMSSAPFTKLLAWDVPLTTRWSLYHYWATMASEKLQAEALVLMARFSVKSTQYKACRMEMDLNVLRNANVVGMTTSGAARLRPLLDRLKPKIMIVEEAAEVLEAHIVASLTRHCQHLILIGDHQQLRPITSTHSMTRDYDMDVSLFERMLNNNLPCVTLDVQHRMRPEIARLISPVIYPNLENHSTVHWRDDVRGVKKSVFFITHNQPEEMTSGKSPKNIHEVKLLVALCRYLILQGYEPSKISIIAMYAAQIASLLSERSAYSELEFVKISTVDGYQGEENDIVLLSLVRSNKAAKIGFLKTVNRVCVALSRARNGLYIVGNMENLTRQKNPIWCNIRETLKQNGSVGTHLHLQCLVHDTFIKINSASDFDFDLVKKSKCPFNCQVKPLMKATPLRVIDMNKHALKTGLDHSDRIQKPTFKDVKLSDENIPQCSCSLCFPGQKQPVACSKPNAEPKALSRATLPSYHLLTPESQKPASYSKPQSTAQRLESYSKLQSTVQKPASYSKPQSTAQRLESYSKLQSTARKPESYSKPQSAATPSRKTFHDLLESKTNPAVIPSERWAGRCSDEVPRSARPLEHASLVRNVGVAKETPYNSGKQAVILPSAQQCIYPDVGRYLDYPTMASRPERIYPILNRPTVAATSNHQPSAPSIADAHEAGKSAAGVGYMHGYESWAAGFNAGTVREPSPIQYGEDVLHSLCTEPQQTQKPVTPKKKKKLCAIM